jgi:soluble cytochrome b562
MKRFIILPVLLLCLSLQSRAQFLGGIFSQNATYKKNLIAQLALLKTYKGYVEKGYNIAKGGLNTIKQFKDGEFDLHRFYFDSLKTVNPKVKTYSKVAEILAMQAQLIIKCNRSRKQARESKQFGDNELAYYSRRFDALLAACDHTLDELTALCTSNRLEMRDDERLRRIDRLWQETTGQYEYTCAITGDMVLLAANRRQERTRLEGVANYYQEEQ